MTWFLLSVATAFAVASADTWVKKWFSHLSHYDMMLYPLIYALPFLCLIAFRVPMPRLDAIFFGAFLAALPLTIIPMLLYMKAIRRSPLSLTVPYLSFTPVFMILTGDLLLGESVDRWGVIGIAVVVAGSYVLNIDTKQRSLVAPLRAVFQETGSWLMLIVAFMFSFSAVVGKMAILHSSVMFFQVWFFIIMTLLMLGLLTLFKKVTPGFFLQEPLKGLVGGIFMITHILCHGYAISMTKAAYMMSVKRLSILFSIVYGGVVFKEDNIRIRFAGAALMFAGACVLLLKAQ